MEAVSIDLALSDPVASFKPLACEIRALLSGDTTNLASRPSFKGPYRPEQGSEGEEDVKRGSIDRPQCNVPKGELSA